MCCTKQAHCLVHDFERSGRTFVLHKDNKETDNSFCQLYPIDHSIYKAHTIPLIPPCSLLLFLAPYSPAAYAIPTYIAFTISYPTMGSQNLRSNPTVHSDSLNNKYKDRQQRNPPSRTQSKASDAVSDITYPSNRLRSPISPLDSHGETWKHPPRAHAQLNGKGPIYDNGAPEGHFELRPFSFYEGLHSPEPDDKSVFADMLAAPPQKRLSRPFEQPYPSYNHGATLEKGKTASGPTQASLPRGDSRHRRQPPTQFSSNRKGNRKGPPTPIVIPKSVHQTNVHRKAAPYQESQGRPQHPARQETQVRGQKPAHHHGWNPLAETSRQQGGAETQHKEKRRNNKWRDDIESQRELLRSKNRCKHDDPEYKSGRRCFFFLMLMFILVIVIIVVIVEKNLHQH